MNSCFDIEIPRIIGKQTACTLTIQDRDLLGSRGHFIRFNLYPIYSPSVLYRRHGYWDIPLTEIRETTVPLQFSEGEIRMKSGHKWAVVKPLWRGNIKFEGYAVLRVSLRERGWIRSRVQHVKASTHLLRPDDRDLQLQQMYVPVTDRCNLNCPECPKPGDDHLNEADIAPEVFHSLLEASPHVFSVMLLGTGEALLNTEIVGMVRALKKRLPFSAKMGTTTNGMLMRSPVSDRLIKEGIDWITFSLRGATAQTHESARPGSDFHQILENIRGVVGRRKRSWRRGPVVQANCVLSEATIDEMNHVLFLCKSLGLDGVMFTHPEDHRSGRILPLEPETLACAVLMATETAKKLRLQITLPPIKRHTEPLCPFMQSHYLWTTGEVVPCCRMHPAAPSQRIRVFGNLKKQALMDVWHSTDYRLFRSMVLAGDFPEVCQDCAYAAGLTG